MPKYKHSAEEKALQKKTFIHYLEEIVLLLATVVAILMADVLQKLTKGEAIENGDLKLNTLNIVASSIVALIVYGKRYTNFKVTDKVKPSFLVRLSDAMIYGIGFKGIIGIGTNGS